MKKLILSLFALLPLLATAQSFTLTPNGFVNADDPTKTFIVVEMEGTQAELFNRAKTAITSMWNSPKDVLSFNEPDIVIVNGNASDLMSIKKIFTTYYDVPYRLQLMFKNGKVRIDAPQAEKGYNIEKRSAVYLGQGKNHGADFYIFNEKGELKEAKNKAAVEAYFNGLTASLIDKMRNGAASDDW